MTLRQFFGVVELRTKVVSLSTFAAATLYALRETDRLDLGTLALALPAVLLVDMGTTAFNSFFDWWRGVDRHAAQREADKVIISEGVPALAALIVAACCYALAMCLGLALALRSGAWVVGLGLPCLAAGFLYNGGPLPLSRTPFGELVAGAFLGTALFMVAYRLQAGGWGSRPLLASLPGALFIASILAVNNACDIQGDALAGRRTLAVLLGPRRAALLPAALVASSIAAAIGLSVPGILPAAVAPATAAAALVSIPLFSGLAKRGFSHATKSASMRGILGAFCVYSLGYLAGLAWAILGIGA